MAGSNPRLLFQVKHFGGINMELYQESGYVNMGAIFDLGLPFNFVVGGRGTGKTYTALKGCVERKEVFFLRRRTQAQTDLVSKPEFSPCKKLNSD